MCYDEFSEDMTFMDRIIENSSNWRSQICTGMIETTMLTTYMYHVFHWKGDESFDTFVLRDTRKQQETYQTIFIFTN